MRIERLHPASLAGERLEVAIVIDVLRATTTAAALLARGVESLAVIEAPDQLGRLPPPPGGSYLLFSEMEEAAAWGERVDNSPALAERIELAGRAPVLVTTNGTRAMVAAISRSRIVMLGAFVNLGALVARVRSLAPEAVALLPAGNFARIEARTEDERCADAIERMLCGEDPDLPALLDDCRTDERVKRRLAREPGLEHDVAVALSVDRYDAVAELRVGDAGICCARVAR